MAAPDELLADEMQAKDDEAQSIEQAWAGEIERRVAEIDSGDVKTHKHDQVMAELDRMIDAERPSGAR